MALGGAGVAAASPGRAPFFNPALLSAGASNDVGRLSLSLNVGARLTDREGFLDGVRRYQDRNSDREFEAALQQFNTHVDRQQLSTEDFDRL